MSVQKPIVFIRGLNTSNTDALCFGPIALPYKMSEPFCKLLRSMGADAYMLEGLGSGSLKQQLENARHFILANQKTFKDGVHLVGHSAGGLVGWGLAADPELHIPILSLTTLATPHQGAKLAELFVSSQFSPSLRLRFFQSMGYNTQAKAHIFKDFTRSSIESFKRENPLHPEFPLAHYSFAVEEADKTWPLWLAHKLGLRVPEVANDGFVEVESQKAGLSLGHYPLDHLAQLGFHFYLNPRQKADKIKLFQQVGESLIQHLETIEKNR